MIADLKPYPEYKESGLPWLGLVPAHWDVLQARHIGRLLKGAGGTKEDAVPMGVPCVRYGELYTTHTFFIHASKAFIRAERAASYTPIQYGDVLFAASGETIEEIGKSAVNLLQTAAVCGGDVIVLRPTIPVYAPFLGYAMDCRPATNQKATMGRGTTVKHIYPDELRGLLVPLPPLAEQAAIARFLDWANGRLDRAIRAKRKVIALLNEQKQAIIHRAVTRGLDPSVPLKPSGIPWLGGIPQHWNVRKIKFLVSTVGGMTPNKSIAGFWDGNVAWVSPKDMKFRVIVDSKDHITDAALRATNITQIQPPAVLIVVRGMILARTFPTAVTAVPVTLNQDMKALIPTEELDASYLASLLTGIQRELLSLVEEAGHGTRCLRTDAWANFPIPVPPSLEQIRINEELKSDTASVNTAISRLEREITLLREYRTRLVADVVTGKLDVRAAAAQLPDEAPPDTAEDDADPSIDPEAADEEAAL